MPATALIAAVVLVLVAAVVVALSLHSIGAAEVGLVTKRLARRSLDEGNPVARRGEAGYQAALLMPGLRFKLWPLYGVAKHPWVQVPAAEIGVVIAAVGRRQPLPEHAPAARGRALHRDP